MSRRRNSFTRATSISRIEKAPNAGIRCLWIVLSSWSQVDGCRSSTGLAVLAMASRAGATVPNDQCVSATVIPVAAPYGAGYDSGPIDTSTATTDVDDPVQSCTGGQNGHSIWFSYTATADVLIGAQVGETTAFDSVLTAYTGTCGALQELRCNDDVDYFDAFSAVLVPVAAGETVLFELTSKGASDGGATHLAVTALPTVTGSVDLPVDAVPADMTKLSACTLDGNLVVTVDYASPLPASGDPLLGAHPAAGYLYLDTDGDPMTPASTFVDPDTFYAGLGVDQTVAFDTYHGAAGAQMAAYPTAIGLSLPLASINATPALRLGVASGLAGRAFDQFNGNFYQTFSETDFGPLLGNLAPGVCVAAACDPTPRTDCRKPVLSAKAGLQLKKGATSASDLLKWSWANGAATTLGDYGFPTLATNYALCLYDESGGTATLRWTATLPPAGSCSGKSCWKTGPTSIGYADKLGTNGGITTMKLGSGAAGKAKISLLGKGANLGLPTLPLSQDSKVTFQVVANGNCWDADFSSPATKNDASQFKDKSN